MKISTYDFRFEREAFVRPFKFKGGGFSEKWIHVVAMRTGSGSEAIGIGSTAVLWSDPRVLSSRSETGGNLAMSTVSEEACRLLCQAEFETPAEAITAIFPQLHERAKAITGHPELRTTFTLNSLIAQDNTLWKLYALEHGFATYRDLLASLYPGVFTCRHDSIAALPAISYDTPLGDIVRYIDDGVFFLKIKLGQPGTQEEMLEKDNQRLEEVFSAVGDRESADTDSGKIAFYLDANGRYESKERLQRLLEHCARIGMLAQILIVEEPFPEELETDVSDLPVRIAADESLHSVDDVLRRIQLGYGAITLKPAGKTTSMSLEMGQAAIKGGVPCLVADSCCIPQLVEWNKNLAACLPLFPGLKCAFMEANGADFYRRWQELLADHPCAGAGWIEPRNGMFVLDETFYRRSGGIFDEPGHYVDLVDLK